MRPVLRNPVPPAGYPYTDDESLREEIIFHRNTAVTNIFCGGNTCYRRISWVLDELGQYRISGHFSVAAIAAYIEPAKGLFDDRLARLYRSSYDSLVRNFGTYCSFCEIPQPAGTHLAVEHRAAKSQYPSYYLYWSNFLLACTKCNSAKGNRPLHDALARSIGNPGASDDTLVEEIKDLYLWPDIYSNTYRAVTQQFGFKDGRAYYTIVDRNPLSRSNTLRSVAGGVVEAEIEGEPMVVLHCIESNDDQMNALLLLTNLTPTTHIGDDRSLLRTTTWINTLVEFDLMYRGAYAIRTHPDRERIFRDTLWANFLQAARRNGFYSVIIRVLQANSRVPGIAGSLVDRFIIDTNRAGFFPGTDRAELP